MGSINFSFELFENNIVGIFTGNIYLAISKKYSTVGICLYYLLLKICKQIFYLYKTEHPKPFLEP